MVFREKISRIIWVGLLGIYITTVAAEIAIQQKREAVYDTYPVIRLATTGMPDAATNPKLELKFLPPMVAGKDYEVSVAANGFLVLSLNEGKQWPIVDDNWTSPLYLKTAKINDQDVLLDGAIQIAEIYHTPTVEASDRMVYMTQPNTLLVNGTNFNVKHTALFFSPPLEDGVDINITPVTTTQVLLIRREGMNWRTEPGPLKLKGIDTGAGILPLDIDLGGRTIAEVQASLEFHGITVETHEETNLYQTSPTLVITGEGFNPEGTSLGFKNALREDINYTIASTTSTSIVLQLSEGSMWRRSTENLPGPLVLLAANGGHGWVALGPTATKTGRKVATIYADPMVVASTTQLHKSHSPVLTIEGKGFNTSPMPLFFFNQEGMDYKTHYVVNIINSENVIIKLLVDEWPFSGELQVLGIDTGAGKVTFKEPITVATVIDDNAPHESGVTIRTSHLQPMYRNEVSRPLQIIGTGFKGAPKLVFSPALSADAYTVLVQDENSLLVTLKPAHFWAPYRTTLYVSSIDVGDGPIVVGGPMGVPVATILATPSVIPMPDRIYATRSAHFAVHGSGFVSSLDASKAPMIELDNVPLSAYTVDPDWGESHVTLRLVAGREWVKGLAGNETVELRVVRVDTGGGPVDIANGGALVAIVHADDEDALCDDSCVYANDKMCDEQDLTRSPEGYDYGWGYSDDEAMFGGFSSSYSLYGSGYGYEYALSFLSGVKPPSCDKGTDCTDCGLKVPAVGLCINTCKFARDGLCDDPRGYGSCAPGTDCQDCGPDGASNFTMFDSSIYSDSIVWGSSSTVSDDSFLLMSDDILLGQEANAVPVYKRTFIDHTTSHHDNEGAGGIFMDVLWAVVILVGGTVSLAFCMLAYRRLKSGGSGGLVPAVYPHEASDEFELTRLTEVTPDVVRLG